MSFRKNSLIVLIGKFFMFPIVSHAQSEDFLESFEVSQINGKVFLSWTIRAGFVCVGVDVLRATDNSNFILIGGVEGVCGNMTLPSKYSFTDNNPVLNSTNYYKLNMGGEGFSQTISVDLFDFNEKGYLIIPHPVSNMSKIHFRNDAALQTTLNMYSSTGALIYSERTNLNYFEVKTAALEIGEYLFSLSSELSTELIVGKLIVIH